MKLINEPGLLLARIRSLVGDISIFITLKATEESFVWGVRKGDVSYGTAATPIFSKWNLSANYSENAHVFTRHTIAMFIEKLMDDNEKV